MSEEAPAVPVPVPASPTQFSAAWWQLQIAANEASLQAAKDQAGKNLQNLSPLQTDVSQLGTMEGQQNLLSKNAQGANYTPGQGRLDAWLSGSATDRSPTPINNVNAGFAALPNNASIYDPNAAMYGDQNAPKRKNVEDYLNGR